MTHNRILLSSINERAIKSYDGSPEDRIDFDRDGKPTERFKCWQAHWLKVAKEMRSELEASGLANSVSALDRVIGFVEKNR